MERIERVSRPRLRVIARRERMLALMCLFLAFVIALPIPLGNLPPAACLLAIALGMVQRDGVLVLAGVAGTLIMLGAAVFALDVVLKWLA